MEDKGQFKGNKVPLRKEIIFAVKAFTLWIKRAYTAKSFSQVMKES
ncbi:hypothetical protein HMPREF1869_01072 [Bacteroidales bacterium KA00251]|nr:hypothetical protein HMPREF1869_01072 [Bacteroidales bacterium KA00251]